MTAAATASGVLTACRPAATRVPLDRLLPAEVTAALRRIVESGANVTPKLVRDLDRRFRIGENHGVSTRRLRTFLERMRKEAGPAADECRASEQTPLERPWSEKLRAHRRRQASVASILDATFGHLADCNPDLWERRAYLMLLGLVYERLATNEEELATDELVALAKVLAEHRRIDARAGAGDRKDDSEGTARRTDGKLPDHFADVVRQVYGADFQNPR